MDIDAPIVNIYTSKYSEYTSDVVETSTSKLYLKLDSRVNTSSYYYAVEFLDSKYYTSWVKSTLVRSDYSSKYYSVDMPSNATSFKVAVFSNSVTLMEENKASLIMSSYQTINKAYDTVRVGVSNTSISVSGWTTYAFSQIGPGGQGGPGGMGSTEEGNSEKSDVSAKGIKAANLIDISDGEIFIKSYDDALHANYGDTLENGNTGIGDVTISGGNLNLYASDDGLHADHTLTISGGNINISYSYEGIEGNIINISGGITHVYSIDDGLNAANKSGVTPQINISGGITDVTVYGQDVDGIDSNGSFTQSGGYVITKGGNSQMSTGLDVDGTASITGGTFVAFGKTEKTLSKGNGINYYTLSGSYNIGEHTVTFPDLTETKVTTKYSYSTIYVFSDNATKISVN